MGCATAAVAARQFKEAGVSGFAGDFNLWLQAPQSGGVFTPGALNVTATVPSWLQYPWVSATATNPSARATFGIYKSPLIYRRENY
jgi:MSHA biogenesis protein MshQ